MPLYEALRDDGLGRVRLARARFEAEAIVAAGSGGRRLVMLARDMDERGCDLTISSVPTLRRLRLVPRLEGVETRAWEIPAALLLPPRESKLLGLVPGESPAVEEGGAVIVADMYVGEAPADVFIQYRVADLLSALAFLPDACDWARQLAAATAKEGKGAFPIGETTFWPSAGIDVALWLLGFAVEAPSPIAEHDGWRDLVHEAQLSGGSERERLLDRLRAKAEYLRDAIGSHGERALLKWKKAVGRASV